MLFSSWWKKATGAVAKTSELSSSGMEIEIAELLYGLMTSKKEKIQKKIKNKPKKLDFSNIVSSKGKSLEIFADESEGNDGLKMKKTRVCVIENGKDDDKKKEKMEIEVDSDSAFEVNVPAFLNPSESSSLEMVLVDKKGGKYMLLLGSI
ncbi:hypothetical protein P8452_38849 [Trifolium repens]|nr:hypothetical protein P8452_38849 [Trifolium repens]